MTAPQMAAFFEGAQKDHMNCVWNVVYSSTVYQYTVYTVYSIPYIYICMYIALWYIQYMVCNIYIYIYGVGMCRVHSTWYTNKDPTKSYFLGP